METHLPVFPLSFGQVAETLSVAHLILPDRIPALRSRIKDFQRREFPPGLNTGKGRAANYTPDHLVLLGVAFQLLELGMTPDRICQLLRRTGEVILLEMRNNLARPIHRFSKHKTVIYFDPRGLSDLRDRDFEEGSPGITIVTVDGLAMHLKKNGGDARLAVIDLMAMMSMLVIGLEEATAFGSKEIIEEIVVWALQK